jgi:hypothetical protein
MRHDVVPGSRFSEMIAGDSTPFGPNRVEVVGVVVEVPGVEVVGVVVEVPGIVEVEVVGGVVVVVVEVGVVADAIVGVLRSTRVTQLATRELRRRRVTGATIVLFTWRPHDLCNQMVSPRVYFDLVAN